MSKKLKVVGVPEHFNYPIRMLKDEGYIAYEEDKSGTGSMLGKLDKGECDIAVVLTEGAVLHAINTTTLAGKDTTNQNGDAVKQQGKVKIAGLYVSSPLDWGIHASYTSRFNTVDDIKENGQDKKNRHEDVLYAISRYGSGSHLMAFVLSKSILKWKNYDKTKFKVIENMDGAIKEMTNGKDKDSMLFLWNKTMTQQHVDAKVFKRIGVIPTPWPCFVFAIREDVLKTRADEVNEFFDRLKKACDTFKQNKNGESIEFIKQSYGLSTADAKEFLDTVFYDSSNNLSNDMLQDVIDTLDDLKLLKFKNVKASDIVSPSIAKLVKAPKSKL